MKYIVTLNGKNYEVEVEKNDARVIGVTDVPLAAPVQSAPAAVAPAAPVPAPAAAPAPAPAAPAPAAAAPLAQGEVVKAPMPGTILSLNCSQGASVKAGDVLLILEAMKMENEIAAPKDGVVNQITVTKGAQVSTGDPLLVIS